MRILAIESSCDDTAAAVVDETGARSSVVASQDDVHRPFGGIVPELASRSHMRSMLPVIQSALDRAGVRLDDIEGVCATRGPGLVGSLLVGLETAKAIALARRLPFVGVNHLEGHLLSPLLDADTPFPYLALIVSGGHTSLYHAAAFGSYRCLGTTRDDAAGEAFDKVAKVLGLGFPGGRVIDELARRGDPRAIAFPRARLKPQRNGLPFAFSFSGLKTAVAQHLRDHPADSDTARADVAASFQEAVVDMLLATTWAAADATGCPRVVIAGGVSANSRLRARAVEEGAARGIPVTIPPMRYCTDNAAMIGLAGRHRLLQGATDPLSVNAEADLTL